jgi:HlyD family secretion protein
MKTSHLSIAVILIGGALFFWKPWETKTDGPKIIAADQFEVIRRELRVTVVESATLEAGKSVDLRSQIEGRATILWLIPEGTPVKKGQKVAELDVSQIRDRLETQKISVARSEAAYITAQKNFEIQKNKNASEIEKSRNDLLFAQLDLEKFLGKDVGDREKTMEEMGERDQQLVDAQSQIELAGEDLRRAKSRLEWTRKLHEKKYVTDLDLEADRIAVLKASNQLKLARNRLHILQTYTLQKKDRELRAARKEAEAQLIRTKLRCEAQLAQQSAELASKQRQDELEKSKLAKLSRQVEASVLIAPQDGLVVYATVGNRRSQSPIDEGTDVRQGQSIIMLPDVSTIRAKTSIHETQIDRMAAGQKVTIKVDAVPDQIFFGRVSRVSVVPDSRSSWFSPDIKLYTTKIQIFGDTTMLRPGQSASVEIQVADLKDVLAVPVQSINRQGRVLYVWKMVNDRPQAQIVKVGLTNDKFIEIKDGLKEGEKVLLREPEGIEAPTYKKENKELEKALKKRESMAADSVKNEMANPKVLGGVSERGSPGTRRSKAANKVREASGKRSGSASILKAIQARFPKEAAGITSLRSIFQNPELRKKIMADPVLKKKMSAMMGGRRRRGEGEGGPRRKPGSSQSNYSPREHRGSRGGRGGR